MRLFRFNFDPTINKICEDDNGWKYEWKLKSKVGYIALKSPIMKEITQNKGPMVRYVKHNIFCFGYIKDRTFFQGIAIFDFPMRFLLVLGILIGISYSSGRILSGGIWSFLFYLMFTFISYDQDEYLLHKAKQYCEK